MSISGWYAVKVLHTQRVMNTRPALVGSKGVSAGVALRQQIPRNLRRNRLPTKRINGALLMRHEHPAGALVELVKIAKTSPSADRILHHPPEAFNGIEVMATVGR
jgi:hypothetical protein